MSTRKQHAVVHRGDHTAESRKHPVLQWIEEFTEWFDQPDHSNAEDFFDTNYSVKTPDGEHWDDGLDGYQEAVVKFYHDPFTKYKHFPFVIVVTEMEGGKGHEYFTHTDLYVNLKGKAAKGEKKVSDHHGQEWDALVPIFYHAELIHVPGAPHGGMKLGHVKIFKDTGVVNALLQARGEKGITA